MFKEEDFLASIPTDQPQEIMCDQEILNEGIRGPNIDSSIINSRPIEDEEEAGPSNNSSPIQIQNICLTPV